MRRVRVYKFISLPLNRFEKVRDYIGYFEGWSSDYEELRDGIGIFPIAIVRKEDGTVASVSIDLIEFIDEE